MPGRLRTASKPSSTVMAAAPYSFFFEVFAAGAVFLAAGTVASISSGVAAAVLVPPASHSISLPADGDRTDSEAAFLHTYLRRLWNFSILRCVKTLENARFGVLAALSQPARRPYP